MGASSTAPWSSTGSLATWKTRSLAPVRIKGSATLPAKSAKASSSSVVDPGAEAPEMEFDQARPIVVIQMYEHCFEVFRAIPLRFSNVYLIVCIQRRCVFI